MHRAAAPKARPPKVPKAVHVTCDNNDTTGDRLIGWYDRGSSLTLADGDELVLDANQVTGLLRVGAAS